jgi:hypothetical protein
LTKSGVAQNVARFTNFLLFCSKEFFFHKFQRLLRQQRVPCLLLLLLLLLLFSSAPRRFGVVATEYYTGGCRAPPTHNGSNWLKLAENKFTQSDFTTFLVHASFTKFT